MTFTTLLEDKMVTKDEITAVLLDTWEHEMDAKASQNLVNIFAVMAENIKELLDTTAITVVE